MKRLAGLIALFVPLALGLQPAAAAELDHAEFRYQRPLAATSPQTPIRVEPDGVLFAHSQPGFADLRIADANGRAVAWRPLPSERDRAPLSARVLNSGSQGHSAVALLDLGAPRVVRDRAALEILDRDFVGRAVVFGADDRHGPFTRLSATGIYDVRGARPARSTVAAFPPSDFRYLLVRVTGASRIAGAKVSGARERPRLLQRTVESMTRREDGTHTLVTLDLGFRDIPVDEIRIAAETRRYERPVEILGSNDGRRFGSLSGARIFRFADSGSAPIPVGAHQRYIRIEIDNGDDAPLGEIKVSAWARSRALLLEGGHPLPYAAYYGNTHSTAPDYDFARLPASALRFDRAAPGRLGREHKNLAFEPPPDRRSFAARNPELVTATLALAALVLGAVGLLVLRKQA